MLVIRNRAQSILFDFCKETYTDGVVLLPISTCDILPITYKKLGIPFEFVDMNEKSLSMDLDLIEKRLHSGPPVWAVHYVYNLGFDSFEATERLDKIKENYNVILIEDRCLCRPKIDSSPDPKADISLYSTGYGKYIDIGGGFAWLQDQWKEKFIMNKLTFIDSDLTNMKKEIQDCIREKREFREEFAKTNWLESNSIFNQTDYIDNVKKICKKMDLHKAEINCHYRQNLPKEILVGQEFENWRFQIRTNKTDEILQSLFENGYFASKHYRPLVPMFSKNEFPCAMHIWNTTVNLFNDFHYTVEMADRTAEIIREVLDKSTI